jgi:hypothetical protein
MRPGGQAAVGTEGTADAPVRSAAISTLLTENRSWSPNSFM